MNSGRISNASGFTSVTGTYRYSPANSDPSGPEFGIALRHAPEAIVRAINVPFVGRREEPGAGREVLLHGVLVEGQTETGFIRNRDEALLHDRLREAFGKVAPPG